MRLGHRAHDPTRAGSAFITVWLPLVPVNRAQHEILIVCCVFDDGAYGNVKRIQEQRFGKARAIASTLRNPDFVAYARGFGALGLHADGPDELRARLDEAFNAGAPALVRVSTGAMPDPWPWFLRGRVC